MENNHQVTVLINCFNEEKLIARAIDSALKQTYKNLEVIIWDDGSTDKTAEIVCSYSEFILIEHNDNRGYGSSIKTGIQNAKNEIICIMDADGTYPIDSIPYLI